MITKKLIITVLVQVVSISLGIVYGYFAFLYAISILDQQKYLAILYGSDR